jgi:hypothetical protein
MIVWLEDMKIRFYPIDGRQNLRDIQNPQWEQSLSKVNYSNIYIFLLNFYFFLVFTRFKISI